MPDTIYSKRNSAISLSRITGMFFIILCHIIGYYSFIPGHESLGQFFSCGVPIFLFISGYLYGGKQIENIKKWYIKRFLTVSVPAIIISIFVIIALSIFGETLSIQSIVAYCLDLEGLLFLNWNVVTSFFSEISSLGPLWFTTVIMLCYLLVPLLSMISRKIRKNVSYCIFFISFIVIGTIISIMLQNYFSLSYFIYFSIGYFAGSRKLLNKVNLPFFIFYSLLFVLALAGRLFLHRYYDDTNLYLAYISVSHFILGNWIVVFFSLLNNKLPKISNKIANAKLIKLFDQYSYYIYLVHGIFCMGAFNLYIFPLPLASIIFILATVISAIILKFISSKVTKPILKLI